MGLPSGTSRRAGHFDRIAREHRGFEFTPEDLPKLDTLRRRLGELRGKHVVEPGCGAGQLTEQLAHWIGPGGRVLAFDCNAMMVELARGRTKAHSHVTTTCAALEAIELPTGASDCVVCFRVWPHFDDVDLALHRISRWLRPAGRLLIVHWAGREKLAAIHATHPAVVEDVFPPQRQLEEAMRRRELVARHWIDTPEEIFIEAIRGPRRLCSSGTEEPAGG
jgi:ubiquinone/menaquinone biosynthesis C-methylase UbiE